MVSFEENAVYSLKFAPDLSSGQEDFLSSCYLPIVGLSACSLYHFFISAYKNEKSRYFSSEDLLTCLGSSLLELKRQTAFLEGAGLMDTFRGEKENKIVYEFILYEPLPAQAFFHNPLFASYLKNRIGERRFLDLRQRFMKSFHADENFLLMSSSFNQVFDLDDEKALFENLSGEELNQAISRYKEPKVTFSEDKFASLMEECKAPMESIKSNINEIARISGLFGVTEKEAADIIFSKCLTSDGEFSSATYTKIASDFHKYGVNRDGEGIKGDEFGNPDVAKRLGLYNSLSPLEFLSHAENAEPTPSQKKLLSSLSGDYKVPNPIINVILDYTLQKCDSSLPDEFALKVAISLMRKGVASASEAMSALYQSAYKSEEKKREKKDRLKKSQVSVNAVEPSSQEEKEETKPFNIEDIVGDTD